VVGIGVATALIGVLAWPLLFTSASFNEDWLNHLWYMWHQSLAIRTNLQPSLFVNYSGGVLYPLYAFYGGTIYALAGVLSLALGNAPLQAYVLTYLLGFAAAYGGWYWMSRMFGVGRWSAHVPGLVFVTSASYLMLIYALGDWPEFLAVSVMPLLIASGLSVLRADRLYFMPALALAASSVVFFGSHLLTVVWGSTVLLFVGLALLACVPQARGEVARAGVVRVLAVIGPALLVNAWFLLPTAAYEAHTVVAGSYPHFRMLLHKTRIAVTAKSLFTLSHAKAAGTIVNTALPVLAMAWVLASIAVFARARRGGPWIRALWILAGATTALIVLMTHVGLLLALPRVYATLQFSFRLESYVLLGISGAVLAVLVLMAQSGRGRSPWAWALAPVVVVSVLGAAQQTDAFNRGIGRSYALSSYAVPLYEKEGLLDYVDNSLPYIKRALPKVGFAPATDEFHASVVVRLRPGQLVDTNIRGGPDLVHVTGARIVGSDPVANDVLEVGGRDGASGKVSVARRGARAVRATISVSPAHGLPVVLGRLLALVGALVLLAELTVLGFRGLRARGAHAGSAAGR
jgi:hypothetical protein